MRSILVLFLIFPAAAIAHLPSQESVACRLLLAQTGAHAPNLKPQKFWQYLMGEEKPKARYAVVKVADDIEVGRTSSAQKILQKVDRFNIQALIEDFSLTYLEAVEVQAQSRINRIRTDKEFDLVVKNVKAQKFVSGIDQASLAQYPAIVAVDVDGVMLDQDSFWVNGFSAFKIKDADKNKNRSVALAPGALIFIKNLKSLGVGVVLYSRNTDALVQALADFITIDGKPLRSLVDGILSSSFLTYPEGVAFADIVTEFPYVKKDLRLLGIDKTIIVDDDLSHIRELDHLQARHITSFDVDRLMSNLKKKVNADGASSKKGKPRDPTIDEIKAAVAKASKFHADQFDAVFDEISDTLAAHQPMKISFSEGFLPFSDLGQRVIDIIQEGQLKKYLKGPAVKNAPSANASYAEAIAWIRAHLDTAKIVGEKILLDDSKDRDEDLSAWGVSR